MAIAPLRPDGPSRERLCRTALRLFAERGYNGVSNREIVEACGLTKGAIYWYFESKEDLFRTVLAETLESFGHRLAEALEEGRGWEQRLRAMFHQFIAVLEDRDDPHRDLLILLVGRFARGPGSERLVGTTYEQLVGFVEQVLSERDASDGVSSRDAATLVHTTGLGILAQASGGRDVARSTLAALLRLLGGGDLDAAPVAGGR